MAVLFNAWLYTHEYFGDLDNRGLTVHTLEQLLGHPLFKLFNVDTPVCSMTPSPCRQLLGRLEGPRGQHSYSTRLGETTWLMSQPKMAARFVSACVPASLAPQQRIDYCCCVQETVVNLAALLVNLIITPLVAGKTEWVWLQTNPSYCYILILG